jgi:hypothetical protein
VPWRASRPAAPASTRPAAATAAGSTPAATDEAGIPGGRDREGYGQVSNDAVSWIGWNAVPSSLR